MKLRNTVFAALAILFACCWSCDANQTSTPTSDDSGSNEQTVLGDSLRHQIPAFKALKYLERYKVYVSGIAAIIDKENSELFPDPDQKLVFGAKVDRLELIEVLKHSMNPNPAIKDSVYIMMGIMDTDSTELIFVTEHFDTLKKETVLRYYDFTRPCPTACPDNGLYGTN